MSPSTVPATALAAAAYSSMTWRTAWGSSSRRGGGSSGDGAEKKRVSRQLAAGDWNSISARSSLGMPWFARWKKPTVSAADFTCATKSGDDAAERSMTGMVVAPPLPLLMMLWWWWWWWRKMAGTVVMPESTRPLTPAMVSSNALSSLRRS
nr:unnamed protein product [Digitaria exilis]